MPKISRDLGPSNRGAASSPGFQTLRGKRLAVTDGAIEFFADDDDLVPSLRLARGPDGTLVVNGEEIGGASYPWVFNVQDYGAVGDGITDDTTAIRNAIDTAYAWAIANGIYYAEVWFPPAIYRLTSNPVNTYLGYSVLPLPIQAGTSRKVTLVFTGAKDAASTPYWQQNGVGHRGGSTLLATHTGLSSGSDGAPCVLGGPTPQNGYGSGTATFNNMCVVLDGISVVVPINPTLGGFDFRGVANLKVVTAGVYADGSPTQLQATPPTRDWTSGLLMPQNFNNDRNVVEDFAVYGLYTGLGVGEHAWTARSASIYCHDGVYIQADSENIHSSAFGSISVEACTNGIITNATDSYGAPIHIAAISFETISGYHIDDNSNGLAGTVNITKLDGPTGLSIRGARNLRIINANQDRGAVTAPTMPLTTVGLVNPFWADADVFIAASGATITSVSIDGVATGATAGWFPIPSGATVALAYSGGTPTWKWWLR